MSLNFTIPVIGTEVEIEKRDLVITLLKWGAIGAALGLGYSTYLNYTDISRPAFSLLEALPSYLNFTLKYAGYGSAIGAVWDNKNIPFKVAGDVVNLCKGKVCEMGDRVLPEPSEKAKKKAAEQNKQKPLGKEPKAITPSRDALRNNDQERHGGDTYNNCTFYGRDEEPRGRPATRSTASRSKTKSPAPRKK